LRGLLPGLVLRCRRITGRVLSGMRDGVAPVPRFVRCIYCHHVARSDEHIGATRFIEVLREDPRGLPIPVRLTMTVPDTGQSYRIGGRRTKNKHYTLEYTIRVLFAL
jgi:hypothetical protein